MDPQATKPAPFVGICIAIALMAIVALFLPPQVAHPAAKDSMPISTPENPDAGKSPDIGAAPPAGNASQTQCVLLTAQWCAACKRFEREQLPELKRRLDAEHCALKLLDVDAEPSEAELFVDPIGRAELPAIVAYRQRWSNADPAQRLIDICGRLYGQWSPDQILAWYHQKVEQSKVPPPREQPPIVGNAHLSDGRSQTPRGLVRGRCAWRR